MKNLHTCWFAVFAAFLFCTCAGVQAAEDSLKVLHEALQDLPASHVVSLHGWNNTKKGAAADQREVKAATESRIVKDALAGFLTAQKWIYRPDLGEPIGTSAAIHVTFKNSRGDPASLSMLAYSYLVIRYPDDKTTPVLWFSIDGDVDLNSAFWSELFEKYSKEWKVEKIKRGPK